MNTPFYRVDAGQYVLHLNGQPVRAPLDSVALVIDKESGTLLRHGEPTAVCAWHAAMLRKLHASGPNAMTGSTVAVQGRFPVDEINCCLSTAGYGIAFLEKLASGRMHGLDFAPSEAEEPFAGHSPG